MAGLLEFWEESKREPWIWGKNDCGLWVGEYIKAKTGHNPVGDVVGAYSSAFGSRRFVMDRGGMVNMVSRFMMSYEDGDEVGVYRFNAKLVCGISSGSAVAFKTRGGMMVSSEADLIKGWNI